MKKLLFILFLSLAACRKLDVTPVPPVTKVDIFSVSEVIVTNETSLFFNLKSAGNYTMTLYDAASDQDRKSTRLNSSHVSESRMPSSA